MISNQFPTIVYGIVGGVIVPLGTLTIGPGGQLIVTSTSGGGGGGSGHFDASGNPRIFDSINNGYWTFTAPNGVGTLDNFSASP